MLGWSLLSVPRYSFPSIGRPSPPNAQLRYQAVGRMLDPHHHQDRENDGQRHQRQPCGKLLRLPATRSQTLQQLLLLLCVSLIAAVQSIVAATSAFHGAGDVLDLDDKLRHHSHRQHRRHHHNCVHDEKIDEFVANVDASSLMAPHRLAPHVDSYMQSFVMDEFLEVVGVPASSSSPRRALAAAATSEASFQPIRIAFDLSKLSSYVRRLSLLNWHLWDLGTDSSN